MTTSVDHEQKTMVDTPFAKFYFSSVSCTAYGGELLAACCAVSLYMEVLLVLALCIYHTTFALVFSLSALRCVGGRHFLGIFFFIVIIDGSAGLESVA